MFRILKQGSFIIFLFLTTNGFSQSLYNGVGHIPESCRIDWTEAGLHDPITHADNSVNITDPMFTGNDDNKISQAITHAGTLPGTTIIFFPTGTYTFTGTINLNSNIILQGEGSSTLFSFSTDKWDNCINIHGGSISKKSFSHRKCWYRKYKNSPVNWRQRYREYY
jgi:hypothetical protein